LEIPWSANRRRRCTLGSAFKALVGGQEEAVEAVLVGEAAPACLVSCSSQNGHILLLRSEQMLRGDCCCLRCLLEKQKRGEADGGPSEVRVERRLKAEHRKSKWGDDAGPAPAKQMVMLRHPRTFQQRSEGRGGGLIASLAAAIRSFHTLPHQVHQVHQVSTKRREGSCCAVQEPQPSPPSTCRRHRPRGSRFGAPATATVGLNATLRARHSICSARGELPMVF